MSHNFGAMKLVSHNFGAMKIVSHYFQPMDRASHYVFPMDWGAQGRLSGLVMPLRRRVSHCAGAWFPHRALWGGETLDSIGTQRAHAASSVRCLYLRII